MKLKDYIDSGFAVIVTCAVAERLRGIYPEAEIHGAPCDKVQSDKVVVDSWAAGLASVYEVKKKVPTVVVEKFSKEFVGELDGGDEVETHKGMFEVELYAEVAQEFEHIYANQFRSDCARNEGVWNGNYIRVAIQKRGKEKSRLYLYIASMTHPNLNEYVQWLVGKFGAKLVNANYDVELGK